ncbi:hypothetical protein HME9302_00027 [Alteripontixanthobacter maritimus]|uniref:Uncharacterized protein n=1 Tax=Alteripontixanthobacter maritimus TaxID=2161824 RepID=A0A369Q9E5_9SPHN|nr:hypothetical protein HME9302_01001 [Alteripontixanthobacter maritimus]RDC66576.1 hypothetical protein HME9302_00027 [Alteripontixanthobacter maritimus]
MGRKTHRTLGDLVQDSRWLYVQCRECHHSAKLDPREVQMICYRNNYAPVIDRLAGQMRCSKCGLKRVYLGPCYPPGFI